MTEIGKWYFKPLSPGDTIREPVHGEFFATDAISDPGVALVREGIQNSLDAQRDGKQVLVRVFLSGDEQAAPASSVKPFFNDVWEHLQARNNGLRSDDLPDKDADCPYLLIEDFGTTGLEGDPTEPFRSRTGKKNHFYHFFRAEGQSDKEESDRGSWGVGKHVFLRSSRISTIFGVTTRADDSQSLMMGKSVLKSHWVGDNYFQGGYYGSLPDPTGFMVIPESDRDAIHEFCEIFDLQRGTDPGLSVIVPWPDGEITDRAIVRSIIRDYFYPILTKSLEAIVETPSIRTVLDADSLSTEIGQLEEKDSCELERLIELAAWACKISDDKRVVLERPDPERAWQWSDELIPREMFDSLQESFSRGDPLAIRLPVTVRPRSGPATPSFFDVYLSRDETSELGHPVFIREGITISRTGAPRTRGVRSIVLVGDLPLSGFLRAAENPSHTEWQHARLRDSYRFGYKTDLAFVKKAVHNIVRALTASERAEDPSLLVDFFSLPATDDQEETVPSAAKKPSHTPGPKPPVTEPPKPRPQQVRIAKIIGGFSVVPGNKKLTLPATLEIGVAYDVRRGNPLKRYSPSDFTVTNGRIRIDEPLKGAKLLLAKDNKIVVRIEEPDFAVQVSGFDERRQLYVNARLKEATGDGTTG